MICDKCNTELLSSSSMDAEDVSHGLDINTHIVTYLFCPHCETKYIREESIDSIILYEGELLTDEVELLTDEGELLTVSDSFITT